MLAEEAIVVDVEGFRQRQQNFIVKELSVRGPNFSDTLFFKPPFAYTENTLSQKRNINWLVKFFHGLSWESGDYDYSFLYTYFTSLKLRFPRAVVYAKGSEKCEFLRNYFVEVRDLNTLGCPKIGDFKSSFDVCRNHLGRTSAGYLPKLEQCARKKAFTFYKWLKENQLENDSSCLNEERSRQSPIDNLPEFEYLSLGTSSEPKRHQISKTHTDKG